MMNPVWRALCLVLLTAGLAACSAQPPGGPAAGDTTAAGPTAPPTVVRRGGGPDTAPTAMPTTTRRVIATVVRPRFRAARPPRMKSPEYGVHEFLWWRPELAERDLLQAKDMGFPWVKQIFGWRDIELKKGVFDWEHTDFIVDTAQRYGGIKLLVRVDHQPEWARSGCSLQGPPTKLQDYADFLSAVATRYRGRIAAYQIWNEPNLAREWCDQAPDAPAYAEMLAVAYEAIKKADPNAIVISAGMAPTGTQPPTAMPDDVFLDELYQAMGGSSEGFFDMLGVHAPGYAAPPELSPAEAAANKDLYGGERYFTFRRVEDLRAIQERYNDANTQLAVLEMGWTSDPIHPEYAWHAVTEETKADYLVRAYGYAKQHWSPWIGVMTTIYICDPDWTQQNEQYWWCITNPDGTPRPAFNALKAMPK
jgi:hypothetical protein